MIVDLHLDGRLVVVVGGGTQGLKRINQLIPEGCDIITYAKQVHPDIQAHADAKKIQLVRQDITDAGFLDGLCPYMVIAATDNRALNDIIVGAAHRASCLAYAADDPDASDFAHLSVAHVKDVITVAVSTGGRSPVVARHIRDMIEGYLNDAISDAHVMQVRLQEDARERAKDIIATPARRRAFLHMVESDETIKRLIMHGDFTGARARMVQMLGECK